MYKPIKRTKATNKPLIWPYISLNANFLKELSIIDCSWPFPIFSTNIDFQILPSYSRSGSLFPRSPETTFCFSQPKYFLGLISLKHPTCGHSANYSFLSSDYQPLFVVLRSLCPHLSVFPCLVFLTVF